jgi:hypothetical protein
VRVWTNGTTVVNAGASTSIEFEIVDLALDGFGNDLALDDISLDGPVPVPEPSAILLVLAAALAATAARSRYRKAQGEDVSSYIRRVLLASVKPITGRK